MNISFSRARPEDAAAILELQKLCFLTEALLYDNYDIPPLKESVDEVRNEILSDTVITAKENGMIVGSVRGHVTESGSCYIGRLSVHPDQRNRGIGSLLMTEIENAHNRCGTFELIAGEKSKNNIRLYRKLGYRITGKIPLSETVNAVRMIKRNKIGG